MTDTIYNRQRTDTLQTMSYYAEYFSQENKKASHKKPQVYTGTQKMCVYNLFPGGKYLGKRVAMYKYKYIHDYVVIFVK